MPMPIMAHAAWWSTTTTTSKQHKTPRSSSYLPSHHTSSSPTPTPNLNNNKTTNPSSTATTTPIPIRAKYAHSNLVSTVTVTTTAVSTRSASESDSDYASSANSQQQKQQQHHRIMSKSRAERRCSTTNTTTTTTTTATSTAAATNKTVDTSPRQFNSSTPISSPVQIPRQSSRTGTNREKYHASQRRRTAKNVHSPDALSPSVAALLAMTDIPRHRPSLRVKPRGSRTAAAAAAEVDEALTIDDIVHSHHVSEKEFSLSLGGIGSPLEVLLSPPDDFATEDDMSTCESPDGSSLRHTVSLDSVPSLAGDSYITDAISSFDSSSYFSSGRVRRTRSPVRKSLEPMRSLPDVLSDEHPLALNLDDDDDYAGYPVMLETVEEPAMSSFAEPFKPLRAVFKSNLTASLRALRSAAKTFSSINFPSLPPDDLLSRSILTIDPNVPYTDERRPPVTEEMPSAELRRYLNPTTRSLEAQQPQDGPPRPRVAAIQMQTYKVHRSRLPSSPSALPSALPPAAIGSTTANTTATATAVANASGGPTQKPDLQSQQQHQRHQIPMMMPAVVRQREIRENPDFIRIAVMEMAMRKRGKLDDRKPGRARWALPPRKALPIKSDDTAAEEIGPNGVPIRWIPITYE